MKSKIKILAVGLFTIFLASCASAPMGVSQYTGFVELPFPSNVYTSGQIVEIYSSPKKVEVTFDPKIEWDKATLSPGLSVSAEQSSKMKAGFAVEISNLLSAESAYLSGKKVSVEFTDVTTRVVQKSDVYDALAEALKNKPSMASMLKDYIKSGTHYDVVTQTISATVAFRVTDSSNAEVSLDSEVIEKLNSKFNADFKKEAGGNKVVSGSNLVIGIHYDPKMIDILLNKRT